MQPVNKSLFGSAARYRAFTLVKYVTYALLSLNIYLFLQEELQALDFTFAGGIEPGQIIQSFSATIDTAAWVLLLLLFELETSVLDDSKLQGWLKWTLHGLRGLCYVAVGYAFSGYYAELTTLYNVAPLAGTDACSLVGQHFSMLIDIDKYVPVDVNSCLKLGSDFSRINGFDIIADAETLRAVQYLAWVDIFNSAAWIGVVIVLEIEVRLQLRGILSGRIMGINKFFKLLMYTILLFAAVYWGLKGDFLDFWDACLWLFAFIFIEMNVFEWQYETTQEEELSSL
ncbi:MAG: hypothetical protein ACI8QT_001465 [Halioglobus sp.]|jgi:hypothetical protein